MVKFTAIYRYAYKNFSNGELVYQNARCYIISETAKSYRIKLVDSTTNHMRGDELWVKKSSIIKRSYYDAISGNCVILEVKAVRNSCFACIRECLTKTILQNGKW